MIKINNVYKSFNDVEVLKDITLEIKKGKLLKIFTINPKIELIILLGFNPPSFVTTNTIAKIHFLCHMFLNHLYISIM